MKINSIRTLSSLEAKVVLGLEWQNRRSVDRKEIAHLLGGNVRTADKVIRSLRDKQWIERVARGRYLLIPAERGPEGIPDANVLIIASLLVDPYYLGYATAAAHYHFTTQSRSTVWVATRRIVADRLIRDTTFRFVTLIERKFFGYTPTKVFEAEVNMSDPEKTVLDCVDRVENAGGTGEVARIILGAGLKIDWERLAAYAAKMGSVALVQRLGYLAERVKVEIPAGPRARLRSHMKRGSRSYLASPVRWGRNARYDAEWQLLVNVPDREILSEV